MGVRAYYVAVPEDVLERAEQDEELWGNLSFEPELTGLPFCFLDKAWSTLWYLLDPAARVRGEEREASTETGHAVMGAHVLGRAFCEHGRWSRDTSGVRGYPRFLRPSEVATASAALSVVTAAQLQEAHDTEQMDIVYCITPEARLWSYFEQLRDFYASAAERGDAVVVHVW